MKCTKFHVFILFCIKNKNYNISIVFIMNLVEKWQDNNI